MQVYDYWLYYAHCVCVPHGLGYRFNVGEEWFFQ